VSLADSVLAASGASGASSRAGRSGVVYQIYPRSFQDSDGDGVGDLRGIERRLDHLEYLGVDALWLSPIYPSPLADFGYDITDHTAIHPQFGSLEDFDALLGSAHRRGIAVLLDLVACHTSIEHPWFREHADWYIGAGSRDGPPNNWTAAFGGSAWTMDERTGRWYMHSFYPEQPDLDWHNPELVAAMQGVVRFWVERGVDGFRLDAIDRLVKDPQLRDDPVTDEPFGLPLLEHELGREFRHSRNVPDTDRALAALREAAGDALLVGEIYQPAAKHAPYLEHLDRAFVFELLFSTWDAESLRAAIEAGVATSGRAGTGAAWVLSNHDFGRLSSRYGPENERAAATLLLTLPGDSFIYQGDEIGLRIGPGAQPPLDRIGRDAFRHPMQWEPGPTGGFTSGSPWLPAVDPEERNVEEQRGDEGSLLSLYRRLIELRRGLGEGFRLVDAEPGVLAYQRGSHLVAINTDAEARRVQGLSAGARRPAVLATHSIESAERGVLEPHAAAIYERDQG
jgi:alpha-glucosidase